MIYMTVTIPGSSCLLLWACWLSRSRPTEPAQLLHLVSCLALVAAIAGPTGPQVPFSWVRSAVLARSAFLQRSS